MYCKHCGKEIVDDTAPFCPQCGGAVSDPTSSSPVPDDDPSPPTETPSSTSKGGCLSGCLIFVVLIIFAVWLSNALAMCAPNSSSSSNNTSTTQQTKRADHTHIWLPATCSSPNICSKCGETKGYPNAHTITNWDITEPISCAETGRQIGTCDICGTTETLSIQYNGHSGEEEIVWYDVDAMLQNGVRKVYCTDCNTLLSADRWPLTSDDVQAYLEEYTSTCQSYTYEEIARNPEQYRSYGIQTTGEIIQVLENDTTVNLRLNMTKTSYGYTDTVYCILTLPVDSPRLLEGDIVRIFGTCGGTITYTSVLGSSITIPRIWVDHVIIEDDG